MCHTSPESFLLWGILSSTLCAFLVSHLWAFDRFRCLQWGSSGGSGAFKRIMTYTYLFSVPLLVVYAIGFSVIKYSEGWISLDFVGIVPKPYQLWSQLHQSMIFPLQICLSVAWGFEIVTHLEELCFWLFLLRSSRSGSQVSWFSSWHFRFWCLGSVAGVAGIPLTVIFHRNDPLAAEAWLFLVGSSASMALTVLFVPVLWSFPNFLRRLKVDGTRRSVVLRLCQFHDLNMIRVCFRFLFVFCFFAMGLDGVMPHPEINESFFWTDLLAMLGSLGLVISSVMTLLIFFPRNLEAEAGYKSSAHNVSAAHVSFAGVGRPGTAGSEKKDRNAAADTIAPWDNNDLDEEAGLPYPASPPPPMPGVLPRSAASPSRESLAPLAALPNDVFAAGPPTLLPPSRVAGATVREQQQQTSVYHYPPSGAGARGRFGGAPPAPGERASRVHPMIRNYVSPIDLIDNYYGTSGTSGAYY